MVCTEHRNLAYIFDPEACVTRFEDDGAAFGPVEGGIGAVRLYYHAQLEAVIAGGGLLSR